MAGFGLRLARSQGMECSTGNLAEFNISPSYSDPIARGDVVKLNGGYLEEASGGADNDDFDILGIFQGCQYVDSDGSFQFRNSWNGGANRTNIRALVAMPVGQNFYIRGRDGTTYTVAGTIGARFGIDWAAQDMVYQDSRITLGASAAALTGPLLVHRLVPSAEANLIGSNQPLFEVSIVRQQLTAAGLGAAFGAAS